MLPLPSSHAQLGAHALGSTGLDHPPSLLSGAPPGARTRGYGCQMASLVDPMHWLPEVGEGAKGGDQAGFAISIALGSYTFGEGVDLKIYI